MVKRNISKNYLKKAYWINQFTIKQIAKKRATTIGKIQYLIKKYNLSKKINNIEFKKAVKKSHSFETKEILHKKAKKTSIVQICKITNKLIFRWASISKASNVLEVDKKSIIRSLKFSKYSAGGYKWLTFNKYLLSLKKSFGRFDDAIEELVDFFGNIVLNKKEKIEFYKVQLNCIFKDVLYE